MRVIVEKYDGPIPEPGTWRLSRGNLDIAVVMPTESLSFKEDPRWVQADIEKYAAWLQEGSRPYPPTVVERVDGKLICLNRRRLAAAIRAGHDSILVWFSPTTKDGMNAWRVPWCSLCDEHWVELDPRFSAVCTECGGDMN